MDRGSSRSSSRDRDRNRDRRRHKKHKHKSRRSRSRTWSPEPRGFGWNGATGSHSIHINPAFGIPPPPQPSLTAPPPPPPPQPPQQPMASQLLEHNRFLESEVNRLKSVLIAEQGAKQIEIQRNQMINNEMRNVTMQRENFSKRCNQMMNERRQLIDKQTELANKVSTLDAENRTLREEKTTGEQSVEAKNEELRALQYQAEIVQEEIAGLNERNAALKTKCETTVAMNRQLQDDINSKRTVCEQAQLTVQKTEADLQLANQEVKRLLLVLESVHKLESNSKQDKRYSEEALLRKEDELRVAIYKSNVALKAANEKIEKLENRLRNEKPVMFNDMTVEKIYSVIEVMKSTYERQLSRMEEEVKMLKSQKLRDHGDPMETGEEPAEQAIEELPEYLQTPQKPNPLRMYSIRKTNQVKIQLDTIPEDRPPRPLSCPPVDSPITWRTRNATSSSSTTVQEPPPSKVPLFGTTGLTKKEKEEPVSTEPTTSATSSLAAPEAIHVECSQEYNEEDLLGEADPSISPILNLDLMEKQLLEEQ